MAGFRKPEVPRDQMVLWSERLEDAVPADHPVRLVDFLLSSGSFAAVFSEWSQEYVLLEGKPPYHPRDLTALYIYGMLNRIRSSRQLEGACYNRLDVIWLMSGQHPDHSTISEFVAKPENSKRLHEVFRQVVHAGIRAGLVKNEHASVDGTKIEADANRGSVHKESSIEARLAQVDATIAALEKEWKENEVRETCVFGGQTPWVPQESGTLAQRQAKLKREQEKLKEALEAIARRREAVGRPSQLKPIASVTDPDSRMMRDKEGRCKPGYNAQIATDVETSMIVATDVNDEAEDSGQLTPMLQRIEENCGHVPAVATADSGYNTGPELAKLEEMGVVAYMPDSGQSSGSPKVNETRAAALAAAHAGQALTAEQWDALPKNDRKQVSKDAFTYEAAQDRYRCPMGQMLPLLRMSRDKVKNGTLIRSHYGGCPACATCPRASMCCDNPAKGRTINRDQYETHRERLRARMESDIAQAAYKLRKQTVEPRFGLIKSGLGVRRFLRRGLMAVRTEWELVATSVNVGILLRNWHQVRPIL